MVDTLYLRQAAKNMVEWDTACDRPYYSNNFPMLVEELCDQADALVLEKCKLFIALNEILRVTDDDNVARLCIKALE